MFIQFWSFYSIEICNVFLKPMDLYWSILSKIKSLRYDLALLSLVNTLMRRKLKICQKIWRNSWSKLVIKSHYFELRWALRFLSLLLNELSYRALLGLETKFFSCANWKTFHFASLMKQVKRSSDYRCVLVCTCTHLLYFYL